MLRGIGADRRWTSAVGFVISAIGLVLIGVALSPVQAAGVTGAVVAELPVTAPTKLGSLKSVPVPLPSDLGDYIQDQQAAVRLGKALFWDTQVGSDGMTACASCHYQAGADGRARNQVNPGHDGMFTTQRPNGTLSLADFPLHKLSDITNAGSSVAAESDDILGSQGVMDRAFLSTAPVVGSSRALDECSIVADGTFAIDGIDVRRVTGRNAPSAINAVFNFRNFWDGRAQNEFNGANPFGDRDANARIYKLNGSQVQPVRISLKNASLASQATGPGLSGVEMSCDGRAWPNVGHKLLDLTPLGLQRVDPSDSVLGGVAATRQSPHGLGLTVSYADLIRQAFRPEFWAATTPVNAGAVEQPQIEANFALFWGLAVQAYEATLVSDDSPFDRYMEGDRTALTPQQQQGKDVFEGKGNCIACHGGPEFTNASVKNVESERLERMVMGDKTCAIYDNGFYNIGVRPTFEDRGVAGNDPFGNPLSDSARALLGTFFDPRLSPALGGMPDCDSRAAVAGSFKAPTLRNVELTGPYFHNGGQATLRQVVDFYSRGGDFASANRADLAADIEPLQLGDAEKDALVAFLKGLTDERVRHQSAPFDHPSLCIPDGEVGSTTAVQRGVGPGLAADQVICLPAVGAAGSADALQPFPGVGLNIGPFVAPALPQPSISLAGDGDGDAAFRGQVTATVSASDEGGPGVATLSYSLDGGPSIVVADHDTVVANKDGSHTLQVVATDLGGNSAPPLSRTFTIDRVAPSVSLALSGTHTGTTYRGPVTATLSGSDNPGGSGLGSITYTLDGDAPVAVVSGTQVTFTTNGRHTLVARATDRAGNVDTTTQVFTIDAHPPTVNISLQGPGIGTAFRGSVIATITATDDVNGGLASLRYKLDGGAAVDISSGDQVLVSAIGPHTLSVTAIDLAGNTTQPAPTVLTISTMAPNPVVSLSGTRGLGNNYRGPVTAVVTTSGGDAPLATLVAALDDAPAATITEGYRTQIGTPGRHTLRIASTDAAGNAATTTATFVVDTLPPVVRIVLDGQSGGTTAYRGALTATVTATDVGEAGVASMSYVLDGAVAQGVPADGKIQVAGEGAHTLEVTATDAAGNKSGVASQSFVIDATAPTASVALAGTMGSAGAYRGPVTATLTASDGAGSGLASLTYSLDAGSRQTIASGGVVTVSADGRHTLQVIATDQAGNTVTETSAFLVDTTAPTVQVYLRGTPGQAPSSFRNNAVVSAAAADEASGSGLASLVYSLDGASPITTRNGAAVIVSGLGRHTLRATATDGAGNTATVARTFSVEPAPAPTIVPETVAPRSNPVVVRAASVASAPAPVTVGAASATPGPASLSAAAPDSLQRVLPAIQPASAVNESAVQTSRSTTTAGPASRPAAPEIAPESAVGSQPSPVVGGAPLASPEAMPAATLPPVVLDLATGGSVASPDGRVHLEVPAGSGEGSLSVSLEPATAAGTETLVLDGQPYSLRVLDGSGTPLVSLPAGSVVTFTPTPEELAAVGGDISLLQVLVHSSETGGLESVAAAPSEDWSALRLAVVGLASPPATAQDTLAGGDATLDAYGVGESDTLLAE